MAGIRPRTSSKGTAFQVYWREGGRGGKQCSETFDRKRDAVIFKGLVDGAGQRYPDGYVPRVGFVKLSKDDSKLTLLEWAPRAINAWVMANARTKHDTLRDVINHVPDWLVAKPMSEITYDQVGTWIGELREKGLSDKTIKNVQGAVSSVVQQAVKDHHVTDNVFKGHSRA